jgi:hypothetical protein
MGSERVTRAKKHCKLCDDGDNDYDDLVHFLEWEMFQKKKVYRKSEYTVYVE